MILKYEDVLKFVEVLKMNVPVKTGNLRDNGIQGIQSIGPGKWMVQIGYPEGKEGATPTEQYAWFTNYRNKSSFGWVDKSLRQWRVYTEQKLNLRKQQGVDANVTNDL